MAVFDPLLTLEFSFFMSAFFTNRTPPWTNLFIIGMLISIGLNFLLNYLIEKKEGVM